MAMIMIMAILAICITGCGISKEVVLDSDYPIVEEPFAIPISAVKSHTQKSFIETYELINKTYEANSKRLFDRLIKNYGITDPSKENRLAQFDESFFINNKVYIDLSNHKRHSSGTIAKMEISKNGGSLNVVLVDVPAPYSGLPTLFEGVLIAVNKEYSKDIKTVNTGREAN